MKGEGSAILVATCLYSTGHWIGGTVCVVLAALYRTGMIS